MQESEEVALLRATAEQGDAEAQYDLGVMYANGHGVAQDYEEAAQLYRAAAEQGLAEAQYTLGVMYVNGQGIAQDYAEAYAWSGTAAAQGFGGAEESRQAVLERMTRSDLERGEELAREYQEKFVLH